jgi:hypothetical protein
MAESAVVGVSAPVAHLRVNVARRRAGQRVVAHLRLAGRRPPTLSFSVVARSGEERGGEKNRNDARVSGERPALQFCCHESHAQPSTSDEWLTHVGLDKAQAGGENDGPSLRCSNLHAVGWVTGHFSLLGRTGISRWAIFGLRIFKCFFLFQKQE